MERALLEDDVLAVVVDGVELGEAEGALGALLALGVGADGDDGVGGCVAGFLAALLVRRAAEGRLAEDLADEREECRDAGAYQNQVPFNAIGRRKRSARGPDGGKLRGMS